MDLDEKEARLAALYADYDGCMRCPLATPTGRGRQRAVTGHGNPMARLLVVTEGPSGTDEQTNRLLNASTSSGAIFDDYLNGQSATRDDVYITSIVMCRATKEDSPQSSRPPTEKEIDACWSRLSQVIEIVDPYVILCLGEKAYKSITGDPRSLTTVARDKTLPLLWATTRGRFTDVTRTAFATFHPSYLARSREELGEAFFRDGGDGHMTYQIVRKAFEVADMHSYLNHGEPLPYRG